MNRTVMGTVNALAERAPDRSAPRAVAGQAARPLGPLRPAAGRAGSAARDPAPGAPPGCGPPHCAVRLP
eukprot:61207-Alexandrium_andersonii.AAC.1